MMNLNRLQGPDSGLAHALDEAFPSLAQDSAIATRISPTSPRNEAAIAILLDQHDDIIFAYLRFARSLNHNINYFPGHGSLSSDQVLAVWALRDCADDEIRTWLGQARKLSSDPEQPKHSLGDTLQAPAFAYLSSTGEAQEILHAPGGGASVCTPVKAIQTKASYLSALNAPGVHPQQTLEKSNTFCEATKTANLYWCTICEVRRRYKNLSDWKKHEKEHVDTYVCMLGGPLEETEGGFKCILCGSMNPSENHLGAHKVQVCGQGVPGSFYCKRRTDLVRHLMKCHDVQGKAQGEAIADKWKETTKKQAWSCGFCIHPIHTFGDRLKHIATHFERGQTLDEWDTTKVIEGLLLQPRMVDAWKTRLAASPGWDSSEIIWKTHAVKGLQHDLEIGPSDTKHAAALAKAAYEARQSSGHLLNGDKPLAFARVHGALGSSTAVPTSHYDSITEPAFKPNSNWEQSQFVANPAEALYYGAPALRGVPMAPHNYGTFPAPSSNDDSSSINVPWLVDPGQIWSSVADQYTDSDALGYQEHSDATTRRHIWQTAAGLSDEADTDDMVE